MCEGMEYNLKDDFICFPRDLAEAHEIINELCDTEKEKIYNNQIMNAYIILFVRHKDYPEEPLCTIQIKDFEIEQKRIFDNEPPPPEIERFIELWKREVLQAPALEMAA